MPVSAQSQKVVEDGGQKRTARSPKSNETMTRHTNDPSLLGHSAAGGGGGGVGGDDKPVSPSSARLRTSPRGEVK